MKYLAALGALVALAAAFMAENAGTIAFCVILVAVNVSFAAAIHTHRDHGCGIRPHADTDDTKEI